jgi:hypothetical protein
VVDCLSGFVSACATVVFSEFHRMQVRAKLSMARTHLNDAGVNGPIFEEEFVGVMFPHYTVIKTS